jgi:hypothetical protein
MATYNAFLEARSQAQLVLSDNEILIAAEKKSKTLIKRIENFRNEKMTAAERAVNSVEQILDSIKTSTLIRSFFRKDPTRQTTHEKTQIEWIQQHKYADAVKMNASVGGMCLSQNKFYLIKDKKRPSDATKTFDVNVPSKKIFAVLKHTSVAGGAQDNQFADVKHFITQIVGYLTENAEAEENFVFYLDGEYYTQVKKDDLNSMIPVQFIERILITNCQSILPTLTSTE